MTPELFAQVASAIGGPGAVGVLWWWLSRPNADKGDPAQTVTEDLRAIREIVHELDVKVSVILDRMGRT